MADKLIKYIIISLLVLLNPLLAKESYVAGKAVYTENLTLPENSVFTVTLEDISLADAPSVELGETVISACGQIPISFKITFDDEKIKLGNRYAIRAKVTQNDKLLYITDTLNSVFSGQDDKNINLIMKRIYKIPKSRPMEGMYKYMADGALFRDCQTGKYYPVAFEENNLDLENAYMDETNASGEYLKVKLEGKIVKRKKIDADLEEDVLQVVRFKRIMGKENCIEQQSDVPMGNNYWKLMSLHNRSIKAQENQREAHMLLKTGLNGIGALKVVTGCNIFKGDYRIKDEEIKIVIKDDADTEKKVCNNEEQEDEFLSVLRNARYWKIEGENLKLADDRNTVLAEFKAIFF